jgi:hypothetical protein
MASVLSFAANCVACRHTNPAGAKFCNECGHALGEAVDPPPAAVRLDPSWRSACVAGPEPSSYEPTQVNAARLPVSPPGAPVDGARRTTHAVLAIVLVSVVAITLGGALILSDRRDSTTTSNHRSTAVMPIESAPAITQPVQARGQPVSPEIDASDESMSARSDAASTTNSSNAARVPGPSVHSPAPCSESVAALGLCDAAPLKGTAAH